MDRRIVIQEPFTEEWTNHVLEFDYVGENGHGFGFACDEDGDVCTAEMNPAALKNYLHCIRNDFPDGRRVVCKGVTSWPVTTRHPLIIKCLQCGAEVMCDRFTNPCDECDADYDMSGHLLAPREQWGEETGEHWSECL